MRSDLKASITQAVHALFELVKEEAAANQKKAVGCTSMNTEAVPNEEEGKYQKHAELELLIKRQTEQIEEVTVQMGMIRDTLMTHQAATYGSERTYASVAAITGPESQQRSALHSVVIAPKDNQETSEEVLDRVRKAVNAKDGWVTVERVRKVKNQRVVVGCKTKEQRDRLKERLKSAGDHLHVEEVKNQDPMLVLRDVLACTSDGDVIAALRNQNGEVFRGLGKGEDRVEFRFRRKARNPHTSHIVLRVSPQVWTRAIRLGALHIDLQKVRVEDQSPLVQCSMCLGYGHSRRFCKETEPRCSHCGGQHLKERCADWLARATPACCNCTAAKLEVTDHSAFSAECAVRRKWDAIARAKVAYC